jgi:hypothetical protein
VYSEQIPRIPTDALLVSKEESERMRMGYEEVTAELLRKVNEISDSMHEMKTTVAILSTQISERKVSQDKEIEELRLTQDAHSKDIEKLKASSNKISGGMVLFCTLLTVLNLVVSYIKH